jgi:hypothetical protein
MRRVFGEKAVGQSSLKRYPGYADMENKLADVGASGWLAGWLAGWLLFTNFLSAGVGACVGGQLQSRSLQKKLVRLAILKPDGVLHDGGGRRR